MKKILFLLSIVIASSQLNANTLPTAKQQKEQEVKDKDATYPGGQEALNEFLKENLRYPKEARRYGKVIIEFTVKKSGKCTDFTVVKSVIDELDYSAIETLQGMPYWEPAVKDGKKVNSKVKLPVLFKPEEDPNR
jgi:TonB family protein